MTSALLSIDNIEIDDIIIAKNIGTGKCVTGIVGGINGSKNYKRICIVLEKGESVWEYNEYLISIDFANQKSINTKYIGKYCSLIGMPAVVSLIKKKKYSDHTNCFDCHKRIK